MNNSLDALSSFDKINLGSAFLQAAVAVSFAAVQHGVSKHFDRPAMRALARLWYLLAIAAMFNIFSSWSGAVWNDRELSRVLNSVAVGLLAAGIPYVQSATDELAAFDRPALRIARLALTWGLVGCVVHAIGVFGLGAGYPDVRVLAVTWSRMLKLVVLSVPAYIAWRAFARATQHRQAIRLLAIGCSALAVRQVIAVLVGLRVGMPDLPMASVIGVITVEVTAIMLFGVMSLLANTAEEVSVVQQQADALMQAKARIASGERMESLGRLAAGVAHDFNNVLHVVRLTTGSVRANLTNEGDREALDDAAAAAMHGAALVSQLLTFARQQTRDPRPFDAFDRLRALTPMLQRVVGAGVECTVTLAGAAAVIVMDPAQFEQIAINLVTNARDAVPRGGRIEVDLGVASVIRGASATANVSPGDYVRLTVEDNGRGIPIEIRSRIFEPFFTTKGGDHGSGLGLATVHGIVQGAGGAITVDSTPGHGTRFEVYLPAVDAVPAASIARPVLPPNVCATAATEAALVAPVGGACPASSKASTLTPR